MTHTCSSVNSMEDFLRENKEQSSKSTSAQNARHLEIAFTKGIIHFEKGGTIAFVGTPEDQGRICFNPLSTYVAWFYDKPNADIKFEELFKVDTHKLEQLKFRPSGNPRFKLVSGCVAKDEESGFVVSSKYEFSMYKMFDDGQEEKMAVLQSATDHHGAIVHEAHKFAHGGVHEAMAFISEIKQIVNVVVGKTADGAGAAGGASTPELFEITKELDVSRLPGVAEEIRAIRKRASEAAELFESEGKAEELPAMKLEKK